MLDRLPANYVTQHPELALIMFLTAPVVVLAYELWQRWRDDDDE